MVGLPVTWRFIGAFMESDLLMAVVTIATAGVRCGRTAAGRVGVAAALRTRGIVFVRTGVTVRVFRETHTQLVFN